jgi:Ca2+-transporting ATPase
LEQKLEVAADQISKFAKLAAVLVVITRIIFLVIRCLASGGPQVLFSQPSLEAIGEIFIVAVVLLMVAVPEGLPLAVSIAMALSITSLKDDEILIKNIDAVQSCAMFNDLCVGKTGTLTSGKLTVRRF